MRVRPPSPPTPTVRALVGGALLLVAAGALGWRLVTWLRAGETR